MTNAYTTLLKTAVAIPPIGGLGVRQGLPVPKPPVGRPERQAPQPTLDQILWLHAPQENSLVAKMLRNLRNPPNTFRGTANVLGSPIGTGKLGNGPGVGFSGAGTQQNMFSKSAGVMDYLNDRVRRLGSSIKGVWAMGTGAPLWAMSPVFRAGGALSHGIANAAPDDSAVRAYADAAGRYYDWLGGFGHQLYRSGLGSVARSYGRVSTPTGAATVDPTDKLFANTANKFFGRDTSLTGRLLGTTYATIPEGVNQATQMAIVGKALSPAYKVSRGLATRAIPGTGRVARIAHGGTALIGDMGAFAVADTFRRRAIHADAEARAKAIAEAEASKAPTTPEPKTPAAAKTLPTTKMPTDKLQRAAQAAKQGMPAWQIALYAGIPVALAALVAAAMAPKKDREKDDEARAER